MNRIDNKAYREGARGESCKLNIEGVCTGDRETVVFAHIRDRHAGRSIKASDISGADACWACHEVFDRRAKMPNGNLMTDLEWSFYALRGLQETLENRIERGILKLPPTREPTEPITVTEIKDGKKVRHGGVQAKRKIPQRKTEWPSRKFGA